MATVIPGGLVGPTGAQIQQQSTSQLQQGATAGAQIFENKRQFNVQQKMATLDKLASQTAGGYMTLLQGPNGSAFVDEMFGGLGVSSATRDRFKETFLNAPPTPQAIYERDLSLFMRSIQEGSGEAAAQEALDSIEQARNNAQSTTTQPVEATPGGTPVGSEVNLPSDVQQSVVPTEGVQPVRNQLIRAIADGIKNDPALQGITDLASLEFNPELKNKVQSIINNTLQTYLKGENLSDADRKVITDMGDSINVAQAYKWSQGIDLPGISQPPDTNIRETTVTNPITIMAETLDTTNVPVREEGESDVDFGNRVGDFVNSIIPRSAEFGRGDEGVTLPDGTVLTPQQATVVRQQIIWNLENGKDPGYIPTPKEKADLPFWQEGYVYGQQDSGTYSSTVPEKKANALSSEYSAIVNDVNSELTANGVVSAQTAQKTKVKVNKILKFRDYDLAEENTPEGNAQREEILNRFNSMLNDPNALRAMAIGMPESAAALLTVADQVRQEKQLANPDSTLNQNLALENAKLQLQFQKLGLDIQKAQAAFIKQSVELGINLTGMDQNTFQKAVLWSMRGEPMLSHEDRLLLADTKANMDALIEKEGNNVVNRADFKAWLDIMNGIMNKATGTDGLKYISEENYGFLDMFDLLVKDTTPFNVLEANEADPGLSTETVPVEEPDPNEAAVADKYGVN